MPQRQHWRKPPTVRCVVSGECGCERTCGRCIPNVRQSVAVNAAAGGATTRRQEWECEKHKIEINNYTCVSRWVYMLY